MKNLARVLSLVLILTMLVSSVAFAGTFTDVEAGSTYAEATSVLSDLGIILGYEDGTFGPDKVITRAEVVAIVNRLQGLSDAAKAAGGTTNYTDVAADAWYAGDVNLATQMGIISGDGNGLFRPDDQVKYEEAVKMMVAACGYTQEYATSRGGWPTGYLVIATEQGITKGLAESAGAPAYRGVVAKLAYQALTAPMMVLRTYETTGNANYAPDSATILLEKQLATHKLSGFVSANSASYIEGNSNTDEGKINFIMTTDKIGKQMNEFSFTTADAANGQKVIKNLLVGETDVDTTLCLATDIYVQENLDGKYEVVAYVVQSAKNNTESIEDPTDIQAFGNASKSSKWDTQNNIYYLSVYDADTDTTNTTYSLDVNAKLLLNGNNIGLVSANLANYINTFSASSLTTTGQTALGLVYAPTSGTVDLIDIDNDGYYDYVKVDSYETAVMDDEPYGNNTKISTTAGTINLDFGTKTNASYTIVLDDEVVDVADLKKDDVLSVAKTDAYHWTIIASRSTVEGQISECDTTSNDMSDWQLVIDGKTYVIANLYSLGDAGLTGVNAGDEGIFYLDAFGNIALYDSTSSGTKDYGFVVAAGQYSSVGDTEYEVRILDKDGNTNTYVLAENVRITDLDNTISGQTTPAATVYNNYIAKMPAFQTGHAADADYAVWTLKANGSYVDYSNNAIATKEAMADNYAGRIITFTVNSSDKISSITFAKSGVDYKNFSLAANAAELTYKAKTASFASSYGVAEDAVIFNLPITNNSTKDDFSVISASSLEDDEKYVVALFSVNEDGNASAMVTTSNQGGLNPDKNLSVVLKAMTANNANGEKVYNVTFVQGGEEKTLATTNDIFNSTTFAKGAVFEYSTDSEGAIDKVAFDGVDNNPLDVNEIAGKNYSAIFNENSNAKVQYVFGAVYDKFAASRTINLVAYVNGGTTVNANNTANIGRHVIPADAQVVVIDCTKSNTAANKVVVGSFGDIQSSRWINGQVDEDRDYAVLVKYYKEEITDIIVYKNYVNKVYYGN